MLQDNLTQTPEDLCAVVRWGDDVLDTAQLRGEGVLDVRAEPPTRPIAGAAHLCLAPVLPEGLRLATRDEAGLTVHVPEDAQAVLQTPGREDAPWTTGTSGPLPEGATLQMRVGAMQISIGRAGGVAALGRRNPVDWASLRVGAMSALGHGFAIGAALVTPAPLGLDLDGLHGRAPIMREVKYEPETKTPTKPTIDPGLRERGGPPSTERTTAAAAPRTRASDREVVMNTGILKALLAPGLASRSVLGGDLGDGINAALTGLTGPASADATGVAGLATRGTGFGGDGDSVGIGGLRTPGGGGGGDVNLGARRHRSVRLLRGRTILGDGLGRAAISRVMRRNSARFKHCYERELNRAPNLEGKVSVQFTIVPDGQVARAKIVESSADDANLEGCVLRVLRTLKFDKPRGGGVVVVTYPFLFVQN